MTIPQLEELSLLHEHICKALGDPKRIQMLYALADRPHKVTDLASALSIPQPTASRHLTVLRNSGLVSTERDGTSVIYSLADPVIITVLDTMRGLLKSALERQSSKLE